jgi:hypothetical protein
MFLVSDVSRPTPELSQHPVEWVPRYFSLGRSGRGVRLTTDLSSAEVKIAWSCTSTQCMHSWCDA